MIARKLKSLRHDLERELYASQIALAEAQRAQALWALPLVREVYVSDMIDLPLGTYQQAKRQGDGPPSFLIGRRSFVLTADLKAWLESRAKNEKKQFDNEDEVANETAGTEPAFSAPLRAARASPR